jgi:tetratricopeptide (TPR) repeat protein
MTWSPDGENSEGFPGRSVMSLSAGGSDSSPVARLDVTGHDRSQQASLGAGTQHNYFGGAAGESELPVSISPPTGQRDTRFPLRGRAELLNELLSFSEGPGVRVIHGMGGCGKTTLVLEAAYLASQSGTEVWWISAAEKSRFLAGIRALGRRLGVADDELRHGEAADLVWRRLSGWSQEWLLVFDNADDPQILAGPGIHTADGTGWLRPLRSHVGRILVTSRAGHADSWGSWCRLHSLGMLGSDAAGHVLADRTGIHHDQLGGNAGAESLADRLGRLPLALCIAGSYLAELAEIPPAFSESVPISSYLAYRETLEQLNTPAADEGRGIIDGTRKLTLDQLKSLQFPEARKLLRLLANLADAPIPYELLLYPPTLSSSGLFPGISGNRLWRVLQALAEFGLIDMTYGSDRAALGVIRLHPLVRDTSLADGSSSELEEYLALAAALVKEAARPERAGPPDKSPSWPRWQLLAPHALHVFETVATGAGCPDESLVAAAYAADRAASYQAAQGLISAAESTHRAVLQVQLRILGTDHPDTIATRYNIACRLSERAEFDQAETEHRDVLEIMRRVLGADHPDSLNVQHWIASVISFRGNYAQAEAEYRDVLAIRLSASPLDDFSILKTRHEIARMMSEQGYYAEAESEFRSVLEALLESVGPNDYGTLITRSQLARTMAAQGQHAMAEAELRDILTAQFEMLGPDHLRTLWTRQQIALMVAAQGDLVGAANQLHEVVEKRQLQIPDHPDTLEARHQLAEILVVKGKKREALNEFRDVLAAKTRVLGPDHPSTVRTARAIESMSGDQDGSI